MDVIFLLSLIGTALWLGGLWLMTRSMRAGMSLQLASTGVFAVLNVSVGAYPGLVGAAVGVVLMVRAIKRAGPRRRRRTPTPGLAQQAHEVERVWAEALSRPAGQVLDSSVVEVQQQTRGLDWAA